MESSASAGGVSAGGVSAGGVSATNEPVAEAAPGTEDREVDAAPSRGAPQRSQPTLATGTTARVNEVREREILKLWQQGRREEAMRRLMDTYGSGLLAYARRMVRSEDTAQDVRQQVLLEVWSGLDKFEKRSSIWTWLCAIVHNRCLDHIKRRGRIDQHEVAVDIDVSKSVLETPDGSMSMQRLPQREALEHCLQRLPEELRAQVLMRCHLGLSYQEIATITGESAGAIQVRLARTLPKLRRCLESIGRDP